MKLKELKEICGCNILWAMCSINIFASNLMGIQGLEAIFHRHSTNAASNTKCTMIKQWILKH